MADDAELDMVSSRVSSLESRVASVESQGSPEEASVKIGLDGAPQPTVDPKGRKIWEAEWRQDYGVMIAYVPDNALVIDGENVEIEADDKDGDEVTVTEGSWYLHIYKSENGGGYSADFDDSATGSRDGETAKFNIRIFDIHEDGYIEKQYVVGSIVMGGGSGDDEDDDTQYDCDEFSVSRVAGEESITGIPVYGNFFFLNGFGKFNKQGVVAPLGTYTPPSELTIDPDSDEATTVAFLVRSGNSSSPNANMLGYRKLKIGKSGISSPFNYEKSTQTDPNTHQPVTTHKLVNCKFYWEGQLKTLADFDVSGIIAGGSVFLVGTQAAPSTSAPTPEWQWTVATAQGQAPNGGKVLNYKLYDFAQGKPSVDYRTTFLSLEDTTQKAKYVFKKPNGSGSVTVDATGESPKIVITNGNGKTITLDIADIPQDCAGTLGIHSLTYTDADGNQQTYHGLFCDDIELPSEGSEDNFKEFIWNDVSISTFHGTEDIDIGTKEIVGSNHIVVTENDGQIVISDTLEDSDVTAGPGITVVGDEVRANTDGASVECANGQTNDLKKIQLRGFNAISSNTAAASVGQSLADQVASGEFLVVAAYINGSYRLMYKTMDPLPIEAATNSGLAVNRVTENNAKKIKVDIAGRGNTALALNDVKSGGTATGVKVFSSAPIELSGIELEEGDGIWIASNGNKRTISADVVDVVSDDPKISASKGSDGIVHIALEDSEEEEDPEEEEPETTGFTGTRDVVKTVWYDLENHQLKKVHNIWTYSNGLLVSIGDDVTTVIETAVAETVS